MTGRNSLGLANNGAVMQPALPKPIFARHETFHPRNGWLKKGVDKLVENPQVFLTEDCPTDLGVGKNMAKAIRYWCWAFKLTFDDWKGTKGVAPSLQPLAELLMGDGGFDPYLEDPASLWLLHWNLLKQPCYATTWDYAFNHFRDQEFTSDSILTSLKAFIAGRFGDVVVSDSSLKNDIACLLRMYCPHSSSDLLSEETLDCPFSALGLITTVGRTKEFNFARRRKRSLPDELIVFASLEFASTIADGQISLNISRLLYEPGGPGLVFRLNEPEICQAIETISERHTEVRLSDSAGRLQMFWNGSPSSLANTILTRYYGR
jgi:hypothetical protein